MIWILLCDKFYFIFRYRFRYLYNATCTVTMAISLFGFRWLSDSRLQLWCTSMIILLITSKISHLMLKSVPFNSIIIKNFDLYFLFKLYKLFFSIVATQQGKYEKKSSHSFFWYFIKNQILFEWYFNLIIVFGTYFIHLKNLINIKK